MSSVLEKPNTVQICIAA